MVQSQTSTAEWLQRRVRQSFYDYWLEKEGIPVYRGNHVEDVYTLPLGEWERIGGRGAAINLADQQQTDGYVYEIAPGGTLNPERHLFEKIIYVLSGTGSTQVWQEGQKPHSFEWAAGSLFAIPLNTWHRHFNGSGSEPARLLLATTAPRQLNEYHNEEFVFNNSYVFSDRFSAEEEDYFSREGHSWGNRSWETNFVPDVNRFLLDQWEEKGAGARHMRFVMGEAAYGCHIHELSPVTYVQAHRHQAGAMILILSGGGYELMFNAGKPRQKYELRPGAIISPGNMMYHQHVNPNPEPLRQLAFRGGTSMYGAGEGGPEAHMAELLKYDQEDPAIREAFYAEVRGKGLDPVLMPLPQRGA
jgi:quercetin dioxygenase-like cupin family protein